ncbi:glycosyltransferase [Paenibacillus sp. CCS19]|uniref:CgeB family protein n=1 Tax=Paenibacillus sp. CCS19 TaxID=3158387 RepID=UPI00295E241D|nr:glycosyltransferase [Paenibacillus cellulosilyticus]
MRILFLERGRLWSYGLPDGLRDLGHEVKVSGPVEQRRLIRLLTSFEPDLLVSVGWGPDHTKAKQRMVRRLATRFHIPLVYWSTEDPNFTDVFTLPLLRRMKPDHTFTISEKTAKRFKKMGYAADYLDYAFHPRVHFRTKFRAKYRTDIAVIANAYPDVLRKYPKLYRRQSLRILVRPLLKQGYRIDFYGRNWSRMKPFLGRSIPKSSIKRCIPYKKANQVFSSAKIVLGLQNYTDMLTQRTFETLGSEGFFLTSDTPAVRALLKPGRDVVVSSSPLQTLAKVRYYLKHDKERERIRRNGRKAIAKHNYTERAKSMLNILRKKGLLK